jgi:hypothetical protein
MRRKKKNILKGRQSRDYTANDRLSNFDECSDSLSYVEGEDVSKYPGRDVYDGEFNNGVRHGFGRYFWRSTNSKYEGDWEDGEVCRVNFARFLFESAVHTGTHSLYDHGPHLTIDPFK